jgi:hypothetical protein
MGFEGADIGLHNIGELIPDLLWQWGWRVHKNVSYATLTLTGKKVLYHLPERLPLLHPQPNIGVQLTASSVRCAPAFGSS